MLPGTSPGTSMTSWVSYGNYLLSCFTAVKPLESPLLGSKRDPKWWKWSIFDQKLTIFHQKSPFWTLAWVWPGGPGRVPEWSGLEHVNTNIHYLDRLGPEERSPERPLKYYEITPIWIGLNVWHLQKGPKGPKNTFCERWNSQKSPIKRGKRLENSEKTVFFRVFLDCFALNRLVKLCTQSRTTNRG